MALRAVAEVNLAAIERNATRLKERIGQATQLCAVVKADGYGHGAEQAARAALRGGATTLAVATALEAGELRRAGLDAPILILGAVSDDELPVAVGAHAELSCRRVAEGAVADDGGGAEVVRQQAAGHGTRRAGDAVVGVHGERVRLRRPPPERVSCGRADRGQDEGGGGRADGDCPLAREEIELHVRN